MTAADPPKQFFHGGAPGRAVGEFVEPPDVTGLVYTRREMAIEGGVTHPITQRRDRVYVTTRRDLAKVFAAEWSLDGGSSGGGWLNMVSVDPDELEDDPDIASLGVSFSCRRARVERIWQRDVKSTPAQSNLVLNGVLDEVKRNNAATRAAELESKENGPDLE